MNKNVKGAIAVGAATLLLLGGGGTFALWNSSQDLNAGTVESGQLALVDGTVAGSPGDSGWYHYDDYIANGTAATPVDLSTYHVVPEDELIYVVEDFGVTAEGNNLFYTFETNIDDVAAAGLGYVATVELFDLVDAATSNSVTDLPGTPATAGTTPGTDLYKVGTDDVATGTKVYAYSSATPQTVNFTAGLKVVFDADDDDFFNSPFNLSTLSFVLQQVIKA